MPYYVTNDYKNFIPYNNKEEAIEMADMFKGIVFLIYPSENLVIHYSNQ